MAFAGLERSSFAAILAATMGIDHIDARGREVRRAQPSGKSTCDGGMLIDLSLLRSTRADSERRVAWVTGGSWLGDMDHETMAFGLVTTAGTVSHTGTTCSG